MPMSCYKERNSKMKTFLAILLVSSLAQAAEKTYHINDKEVSKTDAIKALLANPKTQVFQCQQVELTDKVTLRNK